MRGCDLINTVLPDELLSDIFLRLDASKSSCDAISLVCKRWLKLERASRRTVRIGASGCPDKYMALMLRLFEEVRNVYIDERLTVSSLFPPGLSPRQRLQRSNVRRKKSRASEVKCSSSKLPLSVGKTGSSGSSLESTSLSDDGLTVLAKGCTRLEKLSLIWCSNVTSAGLISIAVNCVALKSLDLQDGSKRCVDVAVSDLIEPNLLWADPEGLD